ncbi:MAG: ribbon-helix-helix protein, CopG family [Acidimicrobiales bacterium]
MLRTQISLTEAQRQALGAESARTGRSISALIRQAVDATFGSERTVEEDLAAMRTAFGSWSASGPDGEAVVAQMRSGSRLRPAG